MKLKYLTLAVALSYGSFAVNAEEHALNLKNVGGKPATPATIKANQEKAKTLDFSDVRAFENDQKGLIAEFDKETVKDPVDSETTT